LAGFEPALRFVDHVNAAFATHNTAVAVPILERAERIANLHGRSPHVVARASAGLRSARLRGPVNQVVGDTGIEPVTPSMSTKCSTAELITHDADADFLAPNKNGARKNAPSAASIKGVVKGIKSFWFSIYLRYDRCKGRRMHHKAYHTKLPERDTSCVVFASPHSGAAYPLDMMRRTVLSDHLIRSSEDAFVDRLFDCAPDFGARFLAACVPRAYVDLNRSPDELDPALIEGVRRHGHNPRVASGLGVIPRVVANGRAIYRGKLGMTEVQQRLDQYWHPYHRRLQELLDEALVYHSQAVLIDCHSMPHEAVESVTRTGACRPDIVLGDRFGAAASGDVVDRVEAAFAAQGFRVARNAPFAGAYIAQAYGRPSRGQHAVQVELDRALYMDEQLIVPNRHFDAVRAALRAAIAEIALIGQDRMPLAAE
jgi:N-formylglutamate amidohydrolase